MRSRGLYVIYDSVSQDILGSVTLHWHPATAIRFFGDLAGAQGSPIGAHPEDYALVRLGYLNDKHELVPDYTVVLEGLTWMAAQRQPAPAPTESGR